MFIMFEALVFVFRIFGLLVRRFKERLSMRCARQGGGIAWRYCSARNISLVIRSIKWTTSAVTSFTSVGISSIHF